MEEHGFEGDFVGVVPEYLKCAVCQLVLREPIQLMKCGHRFCAPCFARLQANAACAKQQLCCPIDRETVDLKTVFQDTGIARVVSNLRVKCCHAQHGCTWVGDLGDFKVHKEGCRFNGHVPSTTCTASSQPLVDNKVLNELYNRMGKIEQDALEKEKDILHLKHGQTELKKQLDKKESDSQGWSVKYANLKNEMKLLRDLSEESRRRSEKEMEVVTLRNQLLENKISAMEKEMNDSKVHVNVDEEMELKMRKIVLTSKGEERDEEAVANDLFQELRNEMNFVRDEINALKVRIEEHETKIDGVEKKCDPDKQKQDLNAQAGYQQAKVDEGIALKALREDIDKHHQYFEDVEHQVFSLENILLHGSDGAQKDKVVVQWKVHNYQQLHNIGETVFSPIFHTQMKDYSFQIFMHWTGEAKECLTLRFKLLRSKDCDVWKELEPYTLMHTLQVVDQRGNIHSKTVPKESFEKFKTSFIINPGQVEVEKSHGWSAFLNKGRLDEFIFNDTLTVRCILDNPQ